MSLKDLEYTLWYADKVCKEYVGLDNYKNYPLKLLMLKKLSDLYEKRLEINKKDNKNHLHENCNQQCFTIPKGCHWNDFKCLKSKFCEKLNEALAAIEKANPQLQGIFANTEVKKCDEVDEKILQSLIWEFSHLDFKNNNLPSMELLDINYEDLIRRYMSHSGKREGSDTPREVAKLLAGLSHVQEDMKIYDPICGSGAFLVECNHYIKRQGCDSNNVSLYGQNYDYETWTTAKINLLMHDITNFDICLGDTIRHPQHVDADGQLMQFDRVMANPPFNLNDWGHEIAENDKYGRFRYGIPPHSRGNFAFIQHILATLNKTGQASILMPHGVLTCGGVEGTIRKNIIKDDLIEAVIGLAPNLFYGTDISPVLLIFNKSKTQECKQKILFIDASSKYEQGKKQNYLKNEDINDILSFYQEFQDKEGYAKVASIQEIADNNYILSIKNYVTQPKPKVDIEAEIIKEICKLHELEAERAKIESDMNECIRALRINKVD